MQKAERDKMESGAEAQRWIGIAEKLLTARDLVGSKTFAIRARESDPNLQPAYQILAVADTLLADDKRINGQHDWYAVLQLATPTQDSQLIASQYQRLSLLLNPQRNELPFADLAFKLISNAWSVLSNPQRKSLYDNSVGSKQQQQPEPIISHPPKKQRGRPRKNPIATPAPAPAPTPTNNNIVHDEGLLNHADNMNHSSGGELLTFWTSCPYCYNMYEYPGMFLECTLRCQNCERAFEAVKLSAPPRVVHGKDGYFCCWAFFPVGVTSLEKKKGGSFNWNPFAPMFNYAEAEEKEKEKGNVNVGGEMSGNGGGGDLNVGGAMNGNGDGVEESLNVGVSKNVKARVAKSSGVRKSSVPRVYIDDDDDYVEFSEAGEDSDDDEWGGSSRRKKKVRRAKGKGLAGKKVKQSQGERAKNLKRGSGEDLQRKSVMQEDVGVPNVPAAETSKKAVGSTSRRQSGRVARDLGKLDLNVEFSNEVEEPPPGMSERNGAGNRAVENIEGVGFFEGLDEFLSSLPILTTPGDDKVKAT